MHNCSVLGGTLGTQKARAKLHIAPGEEDAGRNLLKNAASAEEAQKREAKFIVDRPPLGPVAALLRFPVAKNDSCTKLNILDDRSQSQIVKGCQIQVKDERSFTS